MSSLLMINYYFPPVHVVGAIRSFHFYQNSLSHFEDVHVFTTSSRKYFKQDPNLKIQIKNLHELPSYDLRSLYRTLKKQDSSHISATTKKHRFYPFFSRLLDSFPFNILIGDGGIFYIIKGYQKGKRLVRDQGITHLFSSFRPYSDHIIAYLLKRKYPQSFWIADFRDLHLDEKHGRRLWFWPLQLKLNQLLLKRADILSTVSKGLAKKMIGFNPNIQILPNGISNAPPFTKTSSSYFYITYTGRIYLNEQDASLLFACVAKLINERKLHSQHLRLRYAGPTPEIWEEWAKQFGLESLTINEGFISLQQARKIQAESAINLSLSFSSEQQKGDISSKIYEYLASRHPVLKIINGVKDEEIEAFFKELQAGLLIYNTEEYMSVLESFVLKQYLAWQNGIQEVWPKNVKAYEALKSKHIFDDFFKKIVHESGR